MLSKQYKPWTHPFPISGLDFCDYAYMKQDQVKVYHRHGYVVEKKCRDSHLFKFEITIVKVVFGHQ